MTSTTAETSADTAVPARRYRGKSKQPNWRYDGPLSVIPLELDLSADPQTRRQVEQQFSAAFRLTRAVQRNARSRCRAYWKAVHERERNGPKAVRERLGLTRSDFETTAYRHVDRSKWLRNHLTKAVACHLASNVWVTAKRNLYNDASGKRFGLPRTGKWWDYTKLTGRARSHTKKEKIWETWRLVGSLDGHFEQYGTDEHPDLEAAKVASPGTAVLAQPSALQAPAVPPKSYITAGWWNYRGPLAVVFSGLPQGDLVMPVRLPQGRGSLDRLCHFLEDESSWHKIDLIRLRDRKAPGGWRYQAHLTILAEGYQAESTRQRRSSVPCNRLTGMDANVSNIAVTSMFSSTLKSLDKCPDVLLTDVVTPTSQEEKAAGKAAVKARRRARALDRSRRSTNRKQYDLSRKQLARKQRRERAGLPERTVDVPRGSRDCDAANRPKRAYRKDNLSENYRRVRADMASEAESTARRKQSVAERVAAEMVATHGNRWVTEKVNISAWTRLWGKRIAITTPGRVCAAMRREVMATSGSWRVASTFTTAMSQHCLCGRREKKPLDQRWHSCPDCGLEADRDVLSAALGACVTFTDASNPSTARVDPTLSTVLARRVDAQKEERVRSTIAYRETGGAVGSSSVGRTSAGRNDSTGPPRNRRPKPTRWELGRRRRNSRATAPSGDNACVSPSGPL